MKNKMKKLLCAILVAVMFATCLPVNYVSADSSIHPHDIKPIEIVDKEATCTEDGKKHIKCETCGEIISVITIHATGHSYETEVFAPTETEPGYTKYTCAVCGYSFNKEFPTSVLSVTTDKNNAFWGETITAFISLKGDTAISGFDFNLNYDTAVLEYVSHDITESASHFALKSVVPTGAKLRGAFINLDGSEIIPEGIYAQITFRVISHDVTNTYLKLSGLAMDSQANAIECTVNDKNVGINKIEAFVSVSGTVSSLGSVGDEVFVKLIKKDASDEVIEKFSEIKYEFNDIVAGESYLIEFSKENHVTYVYEFVASREDIMLDVKLHLIGDLNGDGKINTVDVARANAHAKSMSTLTGYEFDCVDINGDGKVNTLDVAKMNAHAKGVTTLW